MILYLYMQEWFVDICST